MKHENQLILSILDKPVSYYPTINQINSGTTISLLAILQSRKHKDLIQTLRNEPDASNQKKLKDTLPCYTVSGVFESRSKEGLVLPSGLAAVDLDSVDNYQPLQVLQELRKVSYIAYSGLSCRGKRLYAIIPLLYPDQYERQYSRLIRSFEDLGLPMGDVCHKNISQPRFISLNSPETEFYNHSAKRYHLLEIDRIYSLPKRIIPVTTNNSTIEVFQWCVNQMNKRQTFQEGNRHNYILQLSRYCNLKGIRKEEALKGCVNFTCAGFTANEIIGIVNYVYEKHHNNFK